MASIVERTTSKNEKRLYLKFRAIDRETGKRRDFWELQPTHAKKAADARKSEVEVALHKSGGLWPADAPMPVESALTLRACGERWLERHQVNLRERVHANYKASLENHVYPSIGDRRMVDMGPADAKELRDAMRRKKLSDDTIRAALVPLRGIVRDWAEDAKRPDPIAGLRLFGKNGGEGRTRRKITPPEAEHITAVVEHARVEARDAILVAAATGLRRGELFGLRWRDIGFDTNEIHVTAYNFGGKVEDGRFKTDAGERDVPLFKSIRRVLLERKARERFSAPDDFVFATSIGTPVDPGNFVKRELRAAVTAANAKRATDKAAALPSFRWHDFRHYAVSMLIAQKADILTLARIAGHSDPNVTLKVYGHLMKGALADAAEKFEPLASVKGLTA